MCPAIEIFLAFMCEKEIRMLNAVERVKGKKTMKKVMGKDVKHLGVTDLPSYVIYRVLTGTKKKIQGGGAH